MTGPEHYRKAQQLLGCLPDSHGSISIQAEGLIIAEAQVHATLALAAPHADVPEVIVRFDGQISSEQAKALAEQIARAARTAAKVTR